MSSTPLGKRPTKKLGGIKRKAVRVPTGELIEFSQLDAAHELPLVCRPVIDGVDLVEWCGANSDRVQRLLDRHGAILFRGFGVRTPERFEKLIEGVSGELLEYKERSTPRSQVQRNVYTSTDYPADQAIFPHNENSYQHAFPLRLFFCCHTASEQGGETPLVDTRRVTQRIPEPIRRRFEEKQILYVRNFGDGMGLDWRSVFQTEDRSEVEAYCRSVGMETQWRSDGRLRVRRRLPALVPHPRTGEQLWFNHATFFHVSTLPPSMRDGLLAAYDEEDLPNNTYYGDGSPIEPETLDVLRRAYLDEKVVFPWKVGDVLILDNMIAAHAREPYRGDRKILTGMSEPHTRGG